MGKGQDAFAPVLGVAAELGIEQRLFADVRTGEDKGIEDFGRRPVVVTIGVTADVARVRHSVVELVGRRIVAADIVIGVVVPTVGTDAKAVFLLVSQIQFGQYVHTLGHRTARREVAVAVVVVPGIGQLAVGDFHPLGVVELQGVVETHRQILVARIDLHGLHG
ncbi:hypothetical protein D3C86_1440670 [compost metagenome]